MNSRMRNARGVQAEAGRWVSRSFIPAHSQNLRSNPVPKWSVIFEWRQLSKWRQRRIDFRCRSALTFAMQDFKARYEKLLAEAADCEIIANLAADRRKRAAFGRLASQYKAMAEAVRAEINMSKMKEAG